MFQEEEVEDGDQAFAPRVDSDVDDEPTSGVDDEDEPEDKSEIESELASPSFGGRSDGGHGVTVAMRASLLLSRCTGNVRGRDAARRFMSQRHSNE